MLEIKNELKKALIVNVYTPNEDNPQFFNNLFSVVNNIEANDKVIVGDLNVILNFECDRKGGVYKHSHAVDVVNAFLKEFEWVDTWRVLNDKRFCYTWRRLKPLIMSRLDYILMPQAMLGKVQKCEVIPGFMSDHSFLKVDLCESSHLRGKGYWKFNTKHLENKEYVDEVNKILDLAEFRYEELDPGTKFESAIRDVREFSVSFSRYKAFETNKQTDYLNKKLNTLEKKLAMINMSSLNAVQLIRKINDKIDPIKSELYKISLHQAQGAILRSKSRFMQLGEHNTSYYLRMEKAKSKGKTINALVKSDGSITRNSREILVMQQNFYAEI